MLLLTEAREEVVSAIEQTAQIYGAKRSYGRLYGILLFADGRMSFDELAEQSGYAKSTVSTAMRGLDSHGLVHRRSVPGEGNKAFYEVRNDPWTAFRRTLVNEVFP